MSSLEENGISELFRAIRVGDSAEIEACVRKEIKRLHEDNANIGQYHLAAMEIVSNFCKFCTNNAIDVNAIVGNVRTLYEKVPQMDESSLTIWMNEKAKLISEQLKLVRNNTSHRLVTEAKAIVKEKYMDPDISLDMVCAILKVSNSYFSSVFKKETGKSFISYLTDYRMDIAAEMILNTGEKSYIVAEKVGYLDANYFSYVFKKKFGTSPSKYRTKYLQKKSE